RPFELPDELFQVVLHYSIQAHQVAVEVVEHLGTGRLRAHEEQRRATGEYLDVTLMRREQRDEAVCQAAFAAQPWNDWVSHFASLYCMDKQVLACPRFVDGAGALAGLAGIVCGLAAAEGVGRTRGGRPFLI